jgi:hypothetical protein
VVKADDHELEYHTPAPQKLAWYRRRWLLIAFLVLLVLSPVLMLIFSLILVALGMDGPD